MTWIYLFILGLALCLSRLSPWLVVHAVCLTLSLPLSGVLFLHFTCVWDTFLLVYLTASVFALPSFLCFWRHSVPVPLSSTHLSPPYLLYTHTPIHLSVLGRTRQVWDSFSMHTHLEQGETVVAWRHTLHPLTCSVAARKTCSHSLPLPHLFSAHAPHSAHTCMTLLYSQNRHYSMGSM